jgi:hypothetical protein
MGAAGILPAKPRPQRRKQEGRLPHFGLPPFRSSIRTGGGVNGLASHNDSGDPLPEIRWKSHPVSPRGALLHDLPKEMRHNLRF